MIHTRCAFFPDPDSCHGKNQATRPGLVEQMFFFLPVLWPPAILCANDNANAHQHDPQIRVPHWTIHHIWHLFQEKQKPRCLDFPVRRGLKNRLSWIKTCFLGSQFLVQLVRIQCFRFWKHLVFCQPQVFFRHNLH